MADALLIDFGLDEAGEVLQRVLPTEITGLDRNDVGETFLQAARGTDEVSRNIAGVTQAAAETSLESTQAVAAAG
jgi:hypothetical protein